MRSAMRGVTWALVIGAGVIAVLIAAVLIGPRPEKSSDVTGTNRVATSSAEFLARTDSMMADPRHSRGEGASARSPETQRLDSESTRSLDSGARDEEELTDSGATEGEVVEWEPASNAADEYAIAIAALTDGDPDRAALGLESLLDAFPGDPALRAKVRTNLARAEIARKNASHALALTEEAIALQPRSDSAWNVRGLALLEAKRGAEAIAAFEHAVSLNGDNVHAQNNLGYVRILRGESALAVAPLRAARESAERLGIELPAHVYNNLGVALEATGALDEAADAFRQAANAGHANASVSLARVEDRLAIGDYRASVDSIVVEEEPLRAARGEEPRP